MEREDEYHSYKVIKNEKHHHKLIAHEFLVNSYKMCPLISRIVKYKLQYFSPQMFEWENM